MSKRKYILVILIVFINTVFANSLNAQSRIDSLQNIKQLIQSNNIVSSSGTGPYVKPSKHWYAFGMLVYLASDDELVEMLNDNSTALKIYAYFGLSCKNYSDLKDIKKDLLKDSNPVNTFFGCISDVMEVGKCVKYFSKHYYSNNSMVAFLNILKRDEKYRTQLYDELINNRNISLPPYE